MSSGDGAEHGGLERARRLVQQAFDAGATWLAPTLAIGLSPGVAVWLWTHPSLASHVLDNRLPRPGRTEAIAYPATTLAITLLALALSTVLGRAKGHHLSQVARRFNRSAAWLIALPVLAVLSTAELGAEHPHLALFLAAVGGIATGVSACEWARRARPPTADSGGWMGLAIVACAAAAYAVHVGGLQLVHHRNLSTGANDLGIYVNVMWRSLHGDLLGSSFLRGGTHLSAHFDPILVALSPLMLLHRGAETLILLQASWLALGAIPVYLLGRARVGPELGVAVALAYLLLPSLHAITIFDFHSLSLSIPIALLAVYLVDRERWWAYGATVALLLTVREDMAFAAACIGAYAIVSKRATRAGLFTILASLAWFVVIKRVVMPSAALLGSDSAQSYGFGGFFSGLTPHGGGARGLAETVGGNPFFLVSNLLVEDRVRSALALLVPVMFLPLLAGRRWVVAAFGLAFLGLTTNPDAYAIGFHYAAVIVPSVFVLAAHGGERTAHRLSGWSAASPAAVRAGLAGAVVAASLGVSLAFGAIWPNETFRAAWYAVEREPTPAMRDRYETLRWMTQQIHVDDSVCASGFTFPHVAARMDVHQLPDCEDDDWVLAFTGRLPGREADGLRTARRSGDYEVVEEADELILLRRRADGGSTATPSSPPP